MSTTHGCIYGALRYMPTAETSAMTEGSTAVWRPQRTPEQPEEVLWKLTHGLDLNRKVEESHLPGEE